MGEQAVQVLCGCSRQTRTSRHAGRRRRWPAAALPERPERPLVASFAAPGRFICCTAPRPLLRQPPWRPTAHSAPLHSNSRLSVRGISPWSTAEAPQCAERGRRRLVCAARGSAAPWPCPSSEAKANGAVCRLSGGLQVAARAPGAAAAARLPVPHHCSPPLPSEMLLHGILITLYNLVLTSCRPARAQQEAQARAAAAKADAQREAAARMAAEAVWPGRHARRQTLVLAASAAPCFRWMSCGKSCAGCAPRGRWRPARWGMTAGRRWLLAVLDAARRAPCCQWGVSTPALRRTHVACSSVPRALNPLHRNTPFCLHKAESEELHRARQEAAVLQALLRRLEQTLALERLRARSARGEPDPTNSALQGLLRGPGDRGERAPGRGGAAARSPAARRRECARCKGGWGYRSACLCPGGGADALRGACCAPSPHPAEDSFHSCQDELEPDGQQAAEEPGGAPALLGGADAAGQGGLRQLAGAQPARRWPQAHGSLPSRAEAAGKENAPAAARAGAGAMCPACGGPARPGAGRHVGGWRPWGLRQVRAAAMQCMEAGQCWLGRLARLQCVCMTVTCTVVPCRGWGASHVWLQGLGPALSWPG